MATIAQVITRDHLVVITIHMGKRETRVGKREPQKVWAVVEGEAISTRFCFFSQCVWLISLSVCKQNRRPVHQAGLVPAFSVMMACTAAKNAEYVFARAASLFALEQFVLSDTVAESGDPTFGSIRRVLFIRR